MSDERKESGSQLRVFAPGASLVKRWTIGGAIVGLLASAALMAAGLIYGGQPLSPFQIAFLLAPISGGTLQGAAFGFCVGYVIARLKRPKADGADRVAGTDRHND